MYPKNLKLPYLYLSTLTIIGLFCIEPAKAQNISPLQVPIPQTTPKLPELPPTQIETPQIKTSPFNLRPIINEEEDKPITIKGFTIHGNTVINDEQLKNTVNPYIGKSIRFNQLNKVIEDINKLYAEQGYITSGAFIPGIVNDRPVKFKNDQAIIPIEIVEGKIENIIITGDKNVKIPVRRQIKESVKPVFNQNRLIETIRLLQVDPKIKRISVSLEPGAETGKSIIKVEAEANKSLSAYAIVDNDSNSQVGGIRRGLIVNDNNLFGIGDTLELNYLNTDGSNQFSGSYTVPISKNEGTITASYNFNSINIIKFPFNALKINTNDNKFDLSFRQPVIRDANTNTIKEVALGASFSYEQSKTLFLDGVAFPNPGADQFGKTNISALRFFQDFSLRSNTQIFKERAQVSIGLPIFGATQNPSPPDSEFLSVNIQAEWLRRLPYGFQLLAQGGAQWSDRPLAPLEQISLGGPLTILGNQSSSLRGDKGFFGTAEILKSIYSSEIGDILIGPFLSGGVVANNSSSIFNLNIQNASLNAGVELKIQLWNRLFGRLSWATPIINDSQNSFSPDNGLSFSVLCRIY